MVRLSQAGKARQLALVEGSPLRRFDPRAKLALCLCASLMVMLPLERLAAFCLIYILLLTWAKLLRSAAAQVWRMRWILIILFAVDWWLVGPDLAAVITLRLGLLAGVFALLFATTSITEFRLALERLRLPYRYAFSLGLAFQSLSLLDDEWRAIREAQKVRGIALNMRGLRSTLRQAGDLVALTVPAVVLTTRRAWAITESAYARGFDSPQRQAYHVLVLKLHDWAMMSAALLVAVSFLFIWR